MTGPEHYREAERLLESCQITPGDDRNAPIYPAIEYAGGDDGTAPVDSCRNALAAAQVHATLALAAIQAERWIDGDAHPDWPGAIS